MKTLWGRKNRQRDREGRERREKKYLIEFNRVKWVYGHKIEYNFGN